MPPGVKFIYLFCTDLAAMRHFYGVLLGLQEIYFSATEGSVAYNCDGLQFTIFEREEAARAPEGWAWQPGWREGTVAQIGWSVVLTEEGFDTAVDRLREVGVATYYDEPQWHGYWSFPVKDPMGNTVEVVYAPEEAE